MPSSCSHAAPDDDPGVARWGERRDSNPHQPGPQPGARPSSSTHHAPRPRCPRGVGAAVPGGGADPPASAVSRRCSAAELTGLAVPPCQGAGQIPPRAHARTRTWDARRVKAALFLLSYASRAPGTAYAGRVPCGPIEPAVQPARRTGDCDGTRTRTFRADNAALLPLSYTAKVFRGGARRAHLIHCGSPLRGRPRGDLGAHPRSAAPRG